MDDGTAAIVVSIVTGFFGLAGVIWSSRRAKNKALPAQDDYSEATIAALAQTPEAPSLDYLAAIKHDVKENRIENREHFREVREELGELRSLVRDGQRESRQNFSDLSEQLRRLNNP